MDEGLQAGEAPSAEDAGVTAALGAVLAYLRERHCYCLYCGVQFADQADMASGCPGPGESDHAEV